MKEEIWKPIFDGIYLVSDRGRVKRASTGRILRNGNSLGYSVVVPFIRGSGVTRKVHHLVAEAFIGPRMGRHVDHINGVKNDNRAANLEYVSRKENARRAVAMGLYKVGARHYRSFVTEEVILVIRARYRKGNGAALGREFGLAKPTVHHIVHRHTWKHI